MRGFPGSAAISLKAAIEATATSMSWSTADLKSDPGDTNHAKIGIRTP